MNRFIALSAEETLSNPVTWFVTDILDGPPVLKSDNGSNIVPVPTPNNVQNSSTRPVQVRNFANGLATDISSRSLAQMSPSPFRNGTNVLYNGSAIVNITAALEPLSAGLALGPYIDYVQSQRIVVALNQNGILDVQWIEILQIPQAPQGAQDSPPQSTPTQAQSRLSGGAVSGIVVGIGLICGIAGIVILKTCI
jgi:hypothetical protein